MRLLEVHVRNGASYGPEGATFGPLGPVGALIGKNNAGKSNIFKLISTAAKSGGDAGQVTDPNTLMLGHATWHGGFGHQPCEVTLRLRFSAPEIPELLARPNPPGALLDADGTAILSTRFDPSQRSALIVGLDPSGSEMVSLLPERKTLATFVGEKLLYLQSQRHIKDEQPVQGASEYSPPLPSNYDGYGLKQWLNYVLTPRTAQDRATRAALMDDLANVEGFDQIRLAIQSSRRAGLDLIVTEGDGGYASRLEECGTGIQTVLIVLCGLLMYHGQVVLVDDADNNLHPSVQSDFIRVAGRRAATNGGQLLFTTHAPAMLSALTSDQIFEVRKENTSSTISMIGRDATSLVAVLRGLGYTPGMLRMASVLVFAEGSSDIAAFTAWWETLFGSPPGPTVVFLPAGGTGNALQLKREALSALGRAVFVILDSDRRSRRDRPSAESQRIISQLGTSADVRVLARRCLESYFTQEAVAKILGRRPPSGDMRWRVLAEEGIGYSKSRDAGLIAAAMPARQIAGEIKTILTDIRSRASG